MKVLNSRSKTFRDVIFFSTRSIQYVYISLNSSYIERRFLTKSKEIKLYSFLVFSENEVNICILIGGFCLVITMTGVFAVTSPVN
jgi:hypothetical protein